MKVASRVGSAENRPPQGGHQPLPAVGECFPIGTSNLSAGIPAMSAARRCTSTSGTGSRVCVGKHNGNLLFTGCFSMVCLLIFPATLVVVLLSVLGRLARLGCRWIVAFILFSYASFQCWCCFLFCFSSSVCTSCRSGTSSSHGFYAIAQTPCVGPRDCGLGWTLASAVPIISSFTKKGG